MLDKIKTISKNHIFLSYSFLFTFGILCVFLPFLLKKNTLICLSDGFNQYYPTYVYITRYIRESVFGIFHGILPKTFDFSIGFGEDVIGSLNQLGFGEILILPFSLIPERFSTLGFSLYTISKLYFAGLNFLIYFKYMKYNEIGSIVGAFFYATSSYMLSFGLCFQNMAYAAMLFPLILLGLEQAFDRGMNGISVLLIVCVGLQALSGFYFLYMDALFGIVYLFVRFVTRGEKTKSDTFSIIGIIILQVFWGVLIGSAFLIPASMAYLNSTRTDSNLGSILSLFIPSGQVIKNLFLPVGYEEGLGMPILVVPFVVSYFRQKCCNTHNKILLAFWMLMYLFPLTGYIMNGFAYPSGRWTYILVSFISISIASSISDYEAKKIGKKRIDIIFISAILIFCCIATGFLNNGPISIGGKGWSACFKSYEEMNNIQTNDYAVLAKKAKSTDRFNRVDITDQSPIDSSLLYGNYSVNSYYSISSGSLLHFYKELLISPGVRSNHLFQGLDGRHSLETLLSVGYYQDGRNDIVDNSSYLPFGVVYDKWIAESDIESMDAAYKNSIILDAIVLDCPDEKTLDTFKCNIEDIERVETTLRTEQKVDVSTENTKKIQMSYKMKDSTSLYYLLIRNLHYSGEKEYVDISIGDRFIRTHSIHCDCVNISDDYMFDISDICKSSDISCVEILIPESDYVSYDSIEIKEVSGDFTNELGSLRENSLEDVRFSNNHVSGTVDIDFSGILFMSMPYSQEWSCYVDGKEREIIRGNFGFCGIPIEKGRHDISLEYHTQGLRLGLLISAIAVVMLLAYLIKEKRMGL